MCFIFVGTGSVRDKPSLLTVAYLLWLLWQYWLQVDTPVPTCLTSRPWGTTSTSVSRKKHFLLFLPGGRIEWRCGCSKPSVYIACVGCWRVLEIVWSSARGAAHGTTWTCVSLSVLKISGCAVLVLIFLLFNSFYGLIFISDVHIIYLYTSLIFILLHFCTSNYFPPKIVINQCKYNLSSYYYNCYSNLGIFKS